jgi:NitT/TauT family transport system substrate-binding protein
MDLPLSFRSAGADADSGAAPGTGNAVPATGLPVARSRRALLTAAAAGTAGLVSATLVGARSAQAQNRLGKVVYGQGSIDPIFTAGYVALKKGFFGEAGLEVEYLNSQSGPRTNQMLAAGQIQFGATAATAAPALTVAGKPAALIFGFDRRMTYANVIVRKDDYDSGKFRSLKDLAGQRVGATQPGSVTALMAVYLMQQAGVSDKVDIRPLGDLATMLGALKTGSVAATMATASMMEQAIQEGWGKAIFDGTSDTVWNEFMGGDVPGIAAYTLRETIEKRPEVVQAFVGGLVKAQDLINSSSAQVITDLVHQDYMNALSKESVLKAVTLYKEAVWLKDNLITEQAYDRMTRIMGDGRQFSNEQIKTVPYAQCADMSFVRKARARA